MTADTYSPTYTQEEMAAFMAALKQYGSEVYACHASGVPLSVVRTLRRLRPEFDAGCDEALELHGGLLYAEAVQRATAGKSDVLLSKLLEAKVQGFSKEARAAEIKRVGTPRTLKLRNFVEDEHGNVVEESDEATSIRPTAGAAHGQSNPRHTVTDVVAHPPGSRREQDAPDDLAAPAGRGAAGRHTGLRNFQPSSGIANLGLWNGI